MVIVWRLVYMTMMTPFTIGPSVVCGVGLPDFTSENFIEDLTSSIDRPNKTSTILDMRYFYEDMPDECREDLCLDELTSDPDKGDFTWLKTQLGYRIYVRCPYSVWEPVYAFRDCDLERNSSVWGEQHADLCPGTPLKQVLLQFQQQQPKQLTFDWLIDSLQAIVDVIEEFPDAPNPEIEDTDIIAHYLNNIIDLARTENTDLNNSNAEILLNIVEVVYDKYYHYRAPQGQPEKLDLVKLVVYVGDLVEFPPEGVTWTFRNDVVTLLIRTDTQQYDKQNVSLDMPSLKTSVTFQLGSIGHEIDALYTVRYVRLVHSDATLGFLTNLTSGVSNASENTTTTPVISPGTQQGFKLIENCQELSPSEEDISRYLVEKKQFLGNDDLSHIRVTYHVEFVTEDLTCRTNIAYLFKGLDEETLMTELICAVSPSKPATSLQGVRGILLDNYCETYVNLSRQELTCQCSSLGYLAVFTPTYSDSQGDYYSWEDQELSFESATISQFLGFEYNRALFIVDQVLRPISIVCLSLTILSFMIFRKIRRGSPTYILVNLCVSLIALLVIMYISQLIGHLKRGCIAANVLRFYFIFVSLMWNAVEAYNLYLKLVKVFKSNIKHFLFKAAVTAWGAPVLLTCVVFAADYRGFNGQYVDCVFRCMLPHTTLYYGYILPMSLIILHNIIVFVLVVRVLVGQGDRPGQDTQKGHWMRLVGAIGVLGLLGVPWIFSAFGALDSTMGTSVETTEFVFQVIFVVTFNLQGIFIFVFHCARVKEVRVSWASSVSKMTGSSTSSSVVQSFTGGSGTRRTSNETFSHSSSAK